MSHKMRKMKNDFGKWNFLIYGDDGNGDSKKPEYQNANEANARVKWVEHINVEFLECDLHKKYFNIHSKRGNKIKRRWKNEQNRLNYLLILIGSWSTLAVFTRIFLQIYEFPSCYFMQNSSRWYFFRIRDYYVYFHILRQT